MVSNIPILSIREIPKKVDLVRQLFNVPKNTKLNVLITGMIWYEGNCKLLVRQPLSDDYQNLFFPNRLNGHFFVPYTFSKQKDIKTTLSINAVL